jgi:D-alanyl-D-alanine carboxypeptidase
MAGPDGVGSMILMTSQWISGRVSRRSLLGGSLAGAALVASGGTMSRAATGADRSPPPLDTQALRAAVSDLTHPPAPSAQQRVSRGADHWYTAAGAADLTDGRSPRPADRFRAGSVTKVLVAAVVLHLWTAHRLRLDAPIGRYLPGLLPPDSARITVAQLLNHTSGLPDHQGLPDLGTPEAVLRHRFDRWTPQQWVDTVAHGPLKFRPGTAQEYRGINYVLLALLVEELTGRPYGEAIASRVLRPLGLDHTLIPGDDPRLHGPHVHGYLRMTDGSLRDVTVFDQSGSWGEGELVSSLDDLWRLQQALFSGELLPPQAMEQLFTMPPDTVRMLDGSPARYSLGLQKATVNGVTFWGKTGETYGYRTRVFATRDRSLSFVLSCTPTPLTTDEDMTQRVVTVLTS